MKCNNYYELLDSVNQRKWHFFTLNSISHFSSYNSNFFRSFWRVSVSTCDHMVTCRYIRESSANRRTVESIMTLVGHLCTLYSKKRHGPKTEP